MTAEAVAVLEHAVQANADAIAQRLVEIGGDAPVAEAVAGGGELAIGVEARPLEHAVENSAASAAPEDHRIPTLEDLAAVDVVEVAEILDVVAHAIDEEVRRAAVTAQDNRVAIAFAGAVGGARHEIEQVGDRPQLLVLDLPFGDHAQRLGNVLDVGVGLGRGAG